MELSSTLFIMGLLFPKISDESRRVQLGQTSDIYAHNQVYTAKYNLLTFVPKSILLQFMKFSNIVFLFNAALQGVPLISSLSPFTAIGPISFVLIVSMLREGYEDYKRHRKDEEINSRVTHILKNGVYQDQPWQNIRVGDYVKVLNGQTFPCDLLMLYSSQENSMCYVQTATLDGQSNLKQKFAFNEGIKAFPTQFSTLRGQVIHDVPTANLYDFYGEITMQNSQRHFIGMNNLLLRETVLRNTDQIVGIALYCGFDTKILLNQGQVHHKISQIDSKLNRIQVFLLIVLILISGVCSVGYYIIHDRNNLRTTGTYIPLQNVSFPVQSGLVFFVNFLLYNFLIPISLVILVQGIKTFTGVLMSIDKKFKDPSTDNLCGVLNTSILEELGVVDCILTDKTGTLTANQMQFRSVVINNRVYTRQLIIQDIEHLKQNMAFNDFFISMIICHEVVKDQLKQEYQGSSPDEVCFVNFAKEIGYEFLKRTKNSIELNVQNEKKVYELIDILSFTNRKRMSVIVKDTCKNSQIIVFTKGADTQIFQKSRTFQYFEQFNQNISTFAKQGLRTLVFAKRYVAEATFNQITEQRNKLKTQMREKIITKQQYEFQQRQVIEDIESDLTVIGATGIEDKLQENVPQTIQRLQRAGITIMMVTGDKLETAENIGYLTRLIKFDYKIIRLTTNLSDLRSECQLILKQILSAHNISVIIEGRQIGKMLEQKQPFYIDIYSKILLKAKSVIFCRSSPKQKSQIVKFVKKHLKVIVLAIGDGGNDVGMIQQAHIGIGLVGKQGNSAAAVSDFSISKFKFLDRLVLHYGRWYYYRFSYFINFYSWKNFLITFIMLYDNCRNGFSGMINFTQFYFVVYNSFFAIGQIVAFGLYDQDINDDLEPEIWHYLPQIYDQVKKKDLFSYKRFILWTLSGLGVSILIHLGSILCLDPRFGATSSGFLPDLNTYRLYNGIILITVLILVLYLDTQSHPLLYELLIFFIGSVLFTAIFFIAEDKLEFLGYYNVYGDNFYMRFYLTIAMVALIIFLVKVGVQTYYFQFQPTLIDIYKKAQYQKLTDIKFILDNAVKQLKGGQYQHVSKRIQNSDGIKINESSIMNGLDKKYGDGEIIQDLYHKPSTTTNGTTTQAFQMSQSKYNFKLMVSDLEPQQNKK